MSLRNPTNGPGRPPAVNQLVYLKALRSTRKDEPAATDQLLQVHKVSNTPQKFLVEGKSGGPEDMPGPFRQLFVRKRTKVFGDSIHALHI